MPHPPAPLIGDLAQCNPVNPRSQRRFAAKGPHSPGEFHEYFLGQVRRIGSVMRGARQQRVNRLMKARNQTHKGFLRASSKSRYQRCVIGLKSRRACDIIHRIARLPFGPSDPQTRIRIHSSARGAQVGRMKHCMRMLERGAVVEVLVFRCHAGHRSRLGIGSRPLASWDSFKIDLNLERKAKN
jgi:hypothetical protein